MLQSTQPCVRLELNLHSLLSDLNQLIALGHLRNLAEFPR